MIFDGDIPSADDRPSPSASALDPAKMLLCRVWALGKCRYGDTCRFLHTWNVGDSFSFLTALKGHHKGIRGIALPSGSDKLYSGSKDKSVRVGIATLARYETPRLTMRYCLVGLSDKCILQRPLASILQRPVWNTQTYNEILLGGPVGQMHFLVTTGFHPPETSGELLFSGQLHCKSREKSKEENALFEGIGEKEEELGSQRRKGIQTLGGFFARISNISTIGGMESYMDFLMLVRERLFLEKYNAFLKALISFKEKRINFPTLERELVENIFKGHPKLILGINKFLVKGNKFTNFAREATIHQFLDKIKDRDQVLYALFLTMQDDYLNGTATMPVSEFCLKVAKICQGHDDLLKEYESFLGAESKGEAFEYASFGRNLSGITLEQSSFDLPSAWRVNRGKELLKFGNKQRRRKMDDKELDCDSYMKKQIKRMRAEKNAESSKDKELENTPCCAFNKISSGNSNDLVSEQLTKEGYLLNSNGCTPSYHLLENYPVPQASYMEDCDASVLNDIVKLVPSSTGGGGSGPKQSAEDLDDARFELDVLISSIKDAIKDGKKLLEKTASNQEIEIENHLSVRSPRCVDQLYGDHWWGIRDLIRTNPQRVLPTIIVRSQDKLYLDYNTPKS
ncbi:hypothetical protein ACLOJK_028849 [Asimina triloba]